MSRYGRPTSGKPLFIETPLWGDVEPHRPSLTVSDNKTVDTGLLWPDGTTIIRFPLPIGFGRDDEW